MKDKKIKTSKRLEQIGLWATIWWAVSCTYVLLLLWLGREKYVELSLSISSGGFFSDWWSAAGTVYDNRAFMPGLLSLIILVWAVGTYVWLRELGKEKINYKAAFKDLFLTIRK